ncbi:MAG: SMP-30/gluconolactonase/LRE family protein [Ignavibacteria bacterium]|nr:SMP-30/gluconolactonase/LRE family protein [Ignavibacteria bacterium]
MKKLFIVMVCAAAVNFSQDLSKTTTLEPVWTKLASDQKFPEGPAWDGVGALYSSSCYGKWITKITDGKPEVFLNQSEEPFTINQTNGLTIGSDGNIYACDYGIGAILKISPEGKSEVYASGFAKKKFNRPNDLAFDNKGNLYFTDPKSYNKDTLDGRVFMVKNDTREVVLVAQNLAFPNGIAFSKDFKTVFVCESAKSRIVKYAVTKDGLLEKQTTFVELPGGDPDGIAFDKNGNLYAAHFGGGAIYVIDPTGEIIYKIKTPGLKPSNIEFGGSDYKTLFLTEDETNSVYETKMRVEGLKLIR